MPNSNSTRTAIVLSRTSQGHAPRPPHVLHKFFDFELSKREAETTRLQFLTLRYPEREANVDATLGR